MHTQDDMFPYGKGIQLYQSSLDELWDYMYLSAFPLTHILFGIDLLTLEISFLHYISMENYFLLLLINTKNLC